MKLRLRGDSIRLRLSKKEVAEIGDGRTVQERVRFPGGGHLTYALVPRTEERIHARYKGEVIEVELGRDLAKTWALNPKHVSLEAQVPIDAGASLSILVEKDFFCRSPRSRPEDESDLFPNPNHGCGG